MFGGEFPSQNLWSHQNHLSSKLPWTLEHLQQFLTETQKYCGKSLIFNHATEVHHNIRHLAFLWKPIHCAQVNFIKNLEEEWLLGNNLLFLLHKVRKHESKGNGKYISSLSLLQKFYHDYGHIGNEKVKLFELHFIIPTLVSNKIHICI